MNPLLAAELVVRASLQKEAIGAVDKAALKYLVAPAAVVGGAGVVANEVLDNPMKRQLQRHRARMLRQRASYDPKTGRMI